MYFLHVFLFCLGFFVAKMSEEALNEMAVISAIFCEKNEFELIEESGEVKEH